MNADALDIPKQVKHLDQIMQNLPAGNWSLDGNYWKGNRKHKPQTEEHPETESYLFVDRRILPDGRIKAGHMHRENGQETPRSTKSTYESLDDLIRIEFVG